MAVAIISVAGVALPPLVFNKSDRVQATWIADPGPDGSLYRITDSPFTQ